MLLAVLRLDADAYGVSVRNEIEHCLRPNCECCDKDLPRTPRTR